MDTKAILIATAIAGGLYIILTIVEKILIKRKSKQLLEVQKNDNGTSNPTDTTTTTN